MYLCSILTKTYWCSYFLNILTDAQVSLLHYNQKILQSPPVQTVMSNFNSYKNSDEEWYSPKFLSHTNGYEMCLRIAANGEDVGQGTHLSLYIHLMAGKNDDKLSWPFRGEVKVQLITHRDDRGHYEQNIVFNDSFNVQACSRVTNGIPVKAGLANKVGEGKALFIGQDKLQTNTSDFLEEDSIIVCIKKVIIHSSPSIEPSTSSESLSVIQKFVIENFSKRKQSNEECISEPFYSHENGYKLSLLVYPNGRDKWKNKYVSLFVHLMKGENDNSGNLTFPFRGDILVQIVNQKEDKNHAERLVEFNKKTDPRGEYGAQVTGLAGLLSGRQYRGYGYPNFLSHKFLEFDRSRNTQYVSDDDTLCVRIMKITVNTK